MLRLSLDWAGATPELLTAHAADQDGSTLFLVVEALPEGGWDWVAWANDHTRRALHGESANKPEAIMAAENAARLLQMIEVFPRVA